MDCLGGLGISLNVPRVNLLSRLRRLDIHILKSIRDLISGSPAIFQTGKILLSLPSPLS